MRPRTCSLSRATATQGAQSPPGLAHPAGGAWPAPRPAPRPSLTHSESREPRTPAIPGAGRHGRSPWSSPGFPGAPGPLHPQACDGGPSSLSESLTVCHQRRTCSGHEGWCPARGLLARRGRDVPHTECRSPGARQVTGDTPDTRHLGSSEPLLTAARSSQMPADGPGTPFATEKTRGCLSPGHRSAL